MECKICGNRKENKEFKIKEMMFGFKDEFAYIKCSKCGCLFIKEIPENMSKYYPSDFGSFDDFTKGLKNLIMQLAKREISRYTIFNRGFVGRLFYKSFLHTSPASLSHINIKLSKDSRILDVGCGSGSFLYALSELGFINLLGIDPYIEKDICYKNGLNVIKKSICDVEQRKYNLIMFHHSFEHIADPLQTLSCVNNLLSSDGTCLIRIPVIDQWAWRNYKTNWVQIDAPRHFFLHSIKSMKILAENAGLEIKHIVYDSYELQFYGSEQYKRDIPLRAKNSYLIEPSKSIFSKKEIKIFKESAKKLNSKNDGDQAAFYLKKISTGF